jgi:hypothetical protein
MEVIELKKKGGYKGQSMVFFLNRVQSLSRGQSLGPITFHDKSANARFNRSVMVYTEGLSY